MHPSPLEERLHVIFATGLLSDVFHTVRLAVPVAACVVGAETLVSYHPFLRTQLENYSFLTREHLQKGISLTKLLIWQDRINLFLFF